MPKKRKAPDRRIVWPAVAERHGGAAVAGKRGRVDKFRVPHGVWTIVVDRYVENSGEASQTYTRVRALFEPSLEFRFKIYRESVFSRFAKRFGFRDATTGDPLLDRDFIVRTDNESMIRSLVQRVGLGVPLMAQPNGRFEIAKFRGKRKPRPERAAELRFLAPGVVVDRDRLNSLIQLFRQTLDGLQAIGAATRHGVEYEL